MKKVIQITAFLNISAGVFLLIIGSFYLDWKMCAAATFFSAFGTFGCPLLIKLIEKGQP